MKDRHSRKSFRIGRVRGDLRGKIWYLTYHENASRHRPRAGSNKQTARQLAVQIHSQLEVGVPAALSFEPISVVDLQRHWPQHHEQVLCSTVHTINRYRSATSKVLCGTIAWCRRRPTSIRTTPNNSSVICG